MEISVPNQNLPNQNLAKPTESLASKINRFFIKLDRLSAWVLFASMLFYFISGYGMTKGIISPSFASKLHLDILPIVIILAFVFHTAYATRLAFMRWGWWNWAMKVVWGLFYLSFILFFGYIELFYQGNFSNRATGGGNIAQQAISDDDDEEGTVATPTTSNSNQSKKFTTAELAQYNGQDGQPAYVAIDGTIYDVSSLFIGGVHFGHVAGKDLTGAFYAQHVKSQIAKYPVVGTLVK